MKYFATLVCLFLLAGNALAQVNLVPNGGFEEFDACPNSFGQIDSCANWFNPAQTQNCTPDFYHTCAEGTFPDIPDSQCNYFPFEGEGVARILFEPGGGEPMEVKLLDTLEAENIYELSMKLKRNCWGGATGSIGALFTDTLFPVFGICDSIGVVPQLQRDPNDIMISFDWYTYTDTLIATGGECYLTITNFLPEGQYVMVDAPAAFPFAVYWIDNVSLTKIGKVNVAEHNSDFPNILKSTMSSEQLEITIDKPVQLYLMDISGRMVLSAQLNIGRSSINLSSIPNGMYVAVFTSESGQTTSRKIVKVN